MQKDYRKHNHEDNFELEIIKKNPANLALNFVGYPTG
jgi:hypothetical protein